MNNHEILKQWLASPDKELALYELGPEKTVQLIEHLIRVGYSEIQELPCGCDELVRCVKHQLEDNRK